MEYAATTVNIACTFSSRPSKWTQLIVTKIHTSAEWIYDLGITALSDVKRSTRSNVKYHRARDLYTKRYIRGSRSNPTFRRRQPASKRLLLPILASIAFSNNVYAFNSETNTAVLALMARHSSPPATTCSSKRHGPLQTKFDTDSFTVGIDNHATACISNNKRHFISMQEWKGSELKGVGTTPILGIGTVRWNISDNAGQKHTLDIPGSLYVPTMSKCLLSPQHVATDCDTCDTGTTGCYTGATTTTFTFGPNGEHSLTVQHNPSTRVPEIKATPSCKTFHAYAANIDQKARTYQLEKYCIPCAMPSTTPAPDTAPAVISDDEDDEDDDTSQMHDPTSDASSDSLFQQYDDDAWDKLIQSDRAQELQEEQDVYATSDKGELLRLHYKYGHLPFNKLKVMAKAGVIPRRLAKCETPKCAACMFGKLTKRAWRSKATAKKIFTATKPGQCVSVDQMESSIPGFLAQLKGRITGRRYGYATVFVDHFSDYTYVHMSESNTSVETIQAKHAFEARSSMMGVKVQHYHCDNGRFADNAFKQSVAKSNQNITYCGVNAHFQNGRAEKKIRDLRESARTQLLHAINRWPGNVTINLWPYALRYAADVHNLLPTMSSLSCPQQRYSGVEVDVNLNNFHAFGCPVYALDSVLAGGKTIGPWAPRARLGINLGFSPRHARTVYNILNIHTATVSPQFHVKHDDFFESVSAGAGNIPSKSLWQSVAGFQPNSNATAIIPPAPPPTATPWVPPTIAPSIRRPLPAQRENASQNNDPQESEPAAAPLPSFIQPSAQHIAVPPSLEPTRIPIDDPTVDDTTIRRSSRIRKPTQRLQESISMGLMEGFESTTTNAETYYDALHEDDYSIQEEMADPIAFMANKKGDPDSLYYHQAMAAPDKIKWQEAMLKEFRSHCERKHWVPVTKEDIPAGTKILDSVWAMKRKRDILTQQITKWKARLNVHGGQQEHGVHYWETYAPVVNWFSIRLLLSQALANNWYTKQVDFVLAYPQADPECEMYMKLPRGIEVPGMNNDTHALKLLKNLYGGRAAGRIWVQYLTTGLSNIGYKQSKVDECVWYKGDIIFTFYVDDGIIWCPREEGIAEFMKDIQDSKKTKQAFDIEDRGDISDYLGINLSRKESGQVLLSQPGLTDQIINEVLGAAKYKARPTPAPSTKILHRDLDGTPFKGDFDYRSVVGKLNFLEKGSRPDLSYAVHQCARFSSNPKESHAEAIRHIAKYLMATREKGILMNPDTSKSFEVHADASFSGEYRQEASEHDASTAKSRSGYVISLHGCPLIWHSKLQTQVALSTTEAEYIALSQSLRDTIPIMNLLQELKDRGFTDTSPIPKIHCKAFEDNSGALELAKTPKMRPRTKHINIVYHHFRSFVKGENPKISVHAIGTLDQTGDIFTKPLDQNLFQRHRKKIMGW